MEAKRRNNINQIIMKTNMTISDWMKVRGLSCIDMAERLNITTQALRNKTQSGKYFLHEQRKLEKELKISISDVAICIENEVTNFNKIRHLIKNHE